MTSNSALPSPEQPAARQFSAPSSLARSVVLVGLMGAGKTSVGRRLALRLGLPFKDADHEIELAAGCSVAEFFERHGEAEFRQGERRVIQRLIAGPPCVLATGGGAFMDPETRGLIRDKALSVWLRCALQTLIRRTSTRTHRPLLRTGDPAQILAGLMTARHPIYAEADLVVDCGDDSPEVTTARVLDAVISYRSPVIVPVRLTHSTYQVLIGAGLFSRAGTYLASALPQKRAVIVTDHNVAPLHLAALTAPLAEVGFEVRNVVVAAGESSKCLATFSQVINAMLEQGVERGTAVIALGGGVVGDLAGFAAATVLRGLPFVQIPTTLLAQVDSSVGGKTGINTAYGKNLVGAFYQPRLVLADTDTLATLPVRELRSGYAEILKTSLIESPEAYLWCEQHGQAVLAGDKALLAEAIAKTCAFKAHIVADDEREERAEGGRALLNLGHTFAHALEAECGYTGELLHGEAVALGLVLAFRLSERLGLCTPGGADRIGGHLHACGMMAELPQLGKRFSAAGLIHRMQRDKKMRDGRLAFVLTRGIGSVFTSRDVPADAVSAVLQQSGCTT